MRRSVIVLGLVGIAGLAGVAGASAHNISRSPASGDINTRFVFRGTGWQSFGTVKWAYFRSTAATKPSQTGRFKLNSGGTFTFNWRDRLVSQTHVLCFTQTDTRVRRTFTKCSPFYVEGPHAWFVPSIGQRGDVFVLIIHGFRAGQRVDGTLTGPTGTIDTFGGPAARRSGFIDGGARVGPIYVPRGGGFQAFQPGSSSPLGTSVAILRQGSLETRAVAVLTG